MFEQVGTSGDLREIVKQKFTLTLFHPSWKTATLIRRERDDKIEEEEAIPTRHAKHRKRRRCRNRSSCFRSDSRVLESSKKDRDSINTVSEIEEGLRDRSGVKSRVQESYNEGKTEDYDVTDTEEEKDRSFILAQRNTSSNDDLELLDSYDDGASSGEIELENVDVLPSTKTRLKKEKIGDNTDYTDEIQPSTIYSAIDDQVAIHEGLSVLLSRLFQSLRNASAIGSQDIFKELNFVNTTNEDPCQKWLNSRDKLEHVFLGGLTSLPACPCQYPSNIFYDDKIWDERQKRYFRWRDVSGDSQRLDVYKPGATYCVRSLLMQGSGSAAAQHCCYDQRRKLLTRGSGAGTPNFVSPEISAILHERIDVLPWRLCKGVFSRYNGVRPPNNDNSCDANPDDEEYQRQIDDTKYY
ncbi:Isthmin-1 [Habropoda laboriosa]|uniref:Isthmin-1 n=1 Tax=Habropoda laboriosa TaxID=597456 RepID=A0A0L7RDK6_9HYME|nr:Isthmin-1 [Habropoda laboriosa]